MSAGLLLDRGFVLSLLSVCVTVNELLPLSSPSHHHAHYFKGAASLSKVDFSAASHFLKKGHLGFYYSTTSRERGASLQEER